MVAADWTAASIAADLPLPCGPARPSANLSCACFGDRGVVANQWAAKAPSRWRHGAVTEVTLSVHVRSAIGRGDSRGIGTAWTPQQPTERSPAAVLVVWKSEVPAAVEPRHRDQVTLVTPPKRQRSTKGPRRTAVSDVSIETSASVARATPSVRRGRQWPARVDEGIDLGGVLEIRVALGLRECRAGILAQALLSGTISGGVIQRVPRAGHHSCNERSQADPYFRTYSMLSAARMMNRPQQVGGKQWTGERCGPLLLRT